jgi:hypothetical protein
MTPRGTPRHHRTEVDPERPITPGAGIDVALPALSATMVAVAMMVPPLRRRCLLGRMPASFATSPDLSLTSPSAGPSSVASYGNVRGDIARAAAPRDGRSGRRTRGTHGAPVALARRRE